LDCWRQFGSNYAAIGAPSIRRINAARLLPTGCGRSTQGACSSTTNPPTGVRHTQRPQRIVTTPPAANRGPVKIVVTLDQKKTFQLLGRIGLWVSRARHDRPARLTELPVMLPDARRAASIAKPAIPPMIGTAHWSIAACPASSAGRVSGRNTGVGRVPRITSLAVAALIALGSAQPAQAEFRIFGGNHLFEMCNSKDAARSLYCDGYIRGIAEALTIDAATKAPEGAEFCLRPTVTHAQVRDIVLTYLRDHPKERDGFAFELVRRAIFDAFPNCRAR